MNAEGDTLRAHARGLRDAAGVLIEQADEAEQAAADGEVIPRRYSLDVVGPDGHDRPTVSLDVPVPIAEAVLALAGFDHPPGCRFTAPDGAAYWVRSEAVVAALRDVVEAAEHLDALGVYLHLDEIREGLEC